MNVTRKELFSIPNILSYIRIILIPIFVYLYLNAQSQEDHYVVASIIIFSGLTDLFDGLIARRFHQITELGKLIDPVADKLTQGAIVFCLVMKYRYMWLIVLLFVFKELALLLGNVVLLRKGKKLDGAKWFGKISTAIFYVCMTALVGLPVSQNWANVLMILTGIFLSLSFVLYTVTFINMYRE